MTFALPLLAGVCVGLLVWNAWLVSEVRLLRRQSQELAQSLVDTTKSLNDAAAWIDRHIRAVLPKN